MIKKYKALILVPLLLGIFGSVVVHADSGMPGSANNPIISKSYADKVFRPLQAEISALQGEVTRLKEKTKPAQIQQFKDVPVGNWAFKDIQYMVDRGIIKGLDTTTFGPDKQAKRSELAALLVKALKLPIGKVDINFTDVLSNHWAYQQIAAAQQAGIIKGFPGNEFRPDAYVTRGQMATMLVRAYALKSQGRVVEFSDVPADHWAHDAIGLLAENGISMGFADKSFRPDILIKRAEVAVLLARTIDPTRRTFDN